MIKYLTSNSYIKKLDKSRPVVVALSTGVDSMVLYHLLLSYGFRVVIAHVNHHKRLQSIDEENYVRILEKTYNTKAYVLDFYYDNGNFQAKAHEKRYEFFYDVVKKENAQCIITAHHYEDSLETILMNLIKGSNLYGYAGIKEYVPFKDTYLLRPLLKATKEEIYLYAKNNNIKFFEDESNNSNDYERNRIRHNIIPLLTEENSNLSVGVTNFSKQLTESFDFIRTTSINFLNGKKEFNTNEFKNLHIAIKKDVLNYLFEEYNIRPSMNKIEKILEIISKEKPNMTYDLGNNYSFIKEYNKCYITEITNNNTTISYDIDLNEIVEITGFGSFKFKESVSNGEMYLKISKSNLPLHFRNRQNSDKIDIDAGHKKLKDYLIDKKVPMSERNNLLIITNNKDEIVWVLNYYRKKCTCEDDLIYLVFEGE